MMNHQIQPNNIHNALVGNHPFPMNDGRLHYMMNNHQNRRRPNQAEKTADHYRALLKEMERTALYSSTVQLLYVSYNVVVLPILEELTKRDMVDLVCNPFGVPSNTTTTTPPSGSSSQSSFSFTSFMVNTGASDFWDSMKKEGEQLWNCGVNLVLMGLFGLGAIFMVYRVPHVSVPMAAVVIGFNCLNSSVELWLRILGSIVLYLGLFLRFHGKYCHCR